MNNNIIVYKINLQKPATPFFTSVKQDYSYSYLLLVPSLSFNSAWCMEKVSVAQLIPRDMALHRLTETTVQ